MISYGIIPANIVLYGNMAGILHGCNWETPQKRPLDSVPHFYKMKTYLRWLILGVKIPDSQETNCISRC